MSSLSPGDLVPAALEHDDLLDQSAEVGRLVHVGLERQDRPPPPAAVAVMTTRLSASSTRSEIAWR
jgi:hypothetical protein